MELQKISLNLLPIYRFNHVVKIWQELKPEIPSIIFPKPNLKFITYNIWFENFNFVERAEELCSIMEKSDCDYICLQEVTSQFLSILTAKKWVCEAYFLSMVKPFYGYTVMLMSKYPFGLYNVPFPSKMGRSLLYGVVNLSGKYFAIATSHFESLNNEKLRAEQMQISFDLLNKYDFACLMGDFNFDNWMEEKRIDANFIDIWKFFNDIEKNPGFTMPATDTFKAWRPDKFLLRKHENLKGKSIKIIGRDPLPMFQKTNFSLKNEQKKENSNEKISLSEMKKKLKIDVNSTNVLTPSDHYGLEIEIEFL